MIPAPVIEERGGRYILRDDLLPGGTKRRALPALLLPGEEYVYASPAQGYAQIALAYAAADSGARATVFTAKRAPLHARTQQAKAAGARVMLVAPGYLTNVQAKARAYCAASGAALLPFGLDTPPFIEALAAAARALPLEPVEVWVAAGSGVLTRALQQAWPRARHYAVQVGKPPRVGRAVLLQAPEPYERDAQRPPPFPSCGNYDAKIWRFFAERAAPGALYWNVGA